MQNAHADGTPTVLYTGVTKIALNMRSQADKDSASLGTLKENETVQIFGFDQEWLFCWRSDVGTYFIGRHNVDNITPVSDDIAPYGRHPQHLCRHNGGGYGALCFCGRKR